ncbi:spore coat U domain-containing protein [Myxococcus sp. XM-1-1-1]|uniref:Csu type fimbrial protein n=1 Tax=Myxococcus sp. XM-1-1-1 TaxID=2874602 RepID=UPI001CBF55E8|nr:spore coat U domain-containing protein [Myxococcus sp. XM-1-1-1]MBZ4409915.1 spore coat U domain-containing protein [Myxococcus sp. XM-1-1-1]
MSRRGEALGSWGLALTGLCWLTPGQAWAACQIRSAVGLNFANYNPTSPLPLDTVGSITYLCLLQLTPMTIDLGPGHSGNLTNRRMRGPTSNTLEYNLYVDATRLRVWGNGVSGTSRYGPVIPVLAIDVTVPIYGRIPAQQTVPAGAYSDTLVMTMTF